MLVFLTGSSGFIGSHLLRALIDAGHRVRCAVRRIPADAISQQGVEYVTADFAQAHAPQDWQPHMSGVDAVVNAVGIIQERGAQRFAPLHEQAPKALFAAAVAAGVARIVQISALGADEGASSRYHLSKRAADEYLLGLPVNALVLQPSLVFGADGASARMFMRMASLPMIPLPGKGEQLIQPVHIDDLSEAVVRWLATPLPGGSPTRLRIAAVGPKAATLRAYLAGLRGLLGFGRGAFLPVPMPLVRGAAAVGTVLPAGLLDRETLQMLERGNHADSSDFAGLLGRTPRAIVEFFRPKEARSVRHELSVATWMALLRVSIALVWIVTGIVSLWVFPREQSLQLLARSGVPEALGPLMLHGAGWLDIALGVGCLLLRQRRWLWNAQIALIAVYTVIISFTLPEFWQHPYGPILKNLPMLAAIALLRQWEGSHRR